MHFGFKFWLEQIIDAIETTKERCEFANKQDDFTDTKAGQEKLDGVCMKLIAVGESLKKIDRITDKKLLANYLNIEWRKMKGIRDFISHHYFDLDAEVIFDICQNHIGELLETLKVIRGGVIYAKSYKANFVLESLEDCKWKKLV